jgi:hypothetical protein
MAGTLKNLLTTLQGSRDGVLPSTQTFPPLDVEQIAAELELDSRAAGNGRTCMPPTDATQPDAVELDVLAEIERRWRKASEEYQAQLLVYDSRIRDAALSADFRVEIEAAGENAITDFAAFSTNDRNHLLLTRTEVQGAQQEYDRFRQSNRLTRLPRIVSSREKLLRGIWLAVAFLIEAFLNGLFFAEGSEAGLIGGVLQAAALSVLNIGAAIAFALYGLPAILHRNIALKLFGVIALCAYLLWNLGLNLLIAHFRDAYIAHAGVVSVDLLSAHFATAPFALADAKSWLLAALGSMLSVTAFISASGLDDSYWGYSALGQRRERAIARYAREQEHCLSALKERRDDAVADMTDVIRELRRHEYDGRLALTGRVTLHRSLQAYVDHLAAAHERLIVRYRTANEAVRRTCPAPAYFRNAPTRLQFLRMPELESSPDGDTDLRATAVARTEHFIKTMNTEFAARLKDYETTRDVTNEDADAAR